MSDILIITLYINGLIFTERNDKTIQEFQEDMRENYDVWYKS